MWVFRSGSDGWRQFQEHGEPGKHVIRPGAGPGGVTVKSDDSAVIDAYLQAL